MMSSPGGQDGHGATDGESAGSELAARSRMMVRRSIGSPVLFTVVYSSLASAIYFSLGVIAGHALGLTPVVFLIAALLFTLTAMTYAEGASLHQDKAGSTVFARYAFNELVSFIAGWAIVLDYIILIAVTAFSATQYLRVFWHPLGHRGEALGLALAFIALVVLSNIRGFGGRRARRVGMLVAGDLLLQGFIVVLGLVLFFNPHTLLSPIHLGSAPSWSGLVFALTVAVIAFTSLESAAGLAGEVRISRGGLKRMVASGAATVVFLYVGIALVAVTALPVHDGHTAPALAQAGPPLPGGWACLGHARGRGQLRHARAFAAGLLAVHQPPDPERAGATASPALHAIRADHPGRGDRGGPRGTRGSRLPGRHLRLRGDARLHDRPSVDLPAALLRARAGPSLPGAPLDHRARGTAAAAGGLRRARLGGRLGGRDGRARTGSLRRPRLDGDGDAAVCRVPARG